MRILYLSQVTPFPLSGGEKIRCYGMLKCLEKSGFDVIAITPASPDPAEMGKMLPGVSFVSHDFQIAGNLAGQFTGYFKKERSLTELLKRNIADKKPDLVFIDYFYLGQYIPLFHEAGIPVIYGTHNAQSELRLAQPANNLKAKIVRFFAWLSQASHERWYFKRSDQLICVSKEDAEFYNRFVPKEKINIIPNFLDESLYQVRTAKKPYIIMTGNFNSFQNFEGLSWFINQVWNEELNESTDCVLAGRGAKDLPDRIGRDKFPKRIRLINEPEDLIHLIQMASAAIVPLWHGSGTRLKCLEAMALKTQLVSTTIGAEGIEHNGSILIADSPELFREFIFKVRKKDIDLTEQAFHIFLERYSLHPNQKKLEDLIYKLLTIQT